MVMISRHKVWRCFVLWELSLEVHEKGTDGKALSIKRKYQKDGVSGVMWEMKDIEKKHSNKRWQCCIQHC